MIDPRIFSLCVSLSLCLSAAAAPRGKAGSREDGPVPLDRLIQMPLDELMKISVTSVTRSEEKLSNATAAVAVLTAEDIRRSGATSIPEALRLVPGLQVARVDSHAWAISSRGFNDVFANKLLVMIDGRTVYTPLFSGVFWDVQDTMLEDIDRIEVIRGPGATLWGANAVNGVINVITRRAKDTQGFLFSGGGGTEEQAFGAFRYGMTLAENSHLRVYGKYFNRDDSALPDGGDANDHWHVWRGGFRWDWTATEESLLTLQGDIYAGEMKDSYVVPTPGFPFAAGISSQNRVGGGNMLARWSRELSADADLAFQVYYDRTERTTAIFSEDRDMIDLDFQHKFGLGTRHRVIWGAGYRWTQDHVENSFNVSLFPRSRSLHLFSGFLQDEIEVAQDRLFLTLGSKIEHNDFTGVEVQPNARLLWTPHDRHSVWASVARAVRTPSRAENDLVLNMPVPGVGVAPILGSRRLDSEELVAYELGYRVQPHARLSLDLAGFYNVYDDLRSVEPVGGFVTQLDNRLEGETYGVELAAGWQVVSNHWRLHAGYSHIEMQLHRKRGGADRGSEAAGEGRTPHHQFFVRSLLDLGRHFQVDSTIRYVDSLPDLGIPSYVALDARLAWRPNPHVELALVGQNLLDSQHPEFSPTFIRSQQTEVERAVYAKLTLRF